MLQELKQKISDCEIKSDTCCSCRLRLGDEEVVDDLMPLISQYIAQRDAELIRKIENEKDMSVGFCKQHKGYFPCVDQDLYQQGVDAAIEILKETQK